MMKKVTAIVLIFFLTVSFTIPVLADSTNFKNNGLVESVVFKIGVSLYVVNGKTPGIKMDVSPLLQNNRTLVPVRHLGNALGVTNPNITWDDSSQTATIKGTNATLQMKIDQAKIFSNGYIKPIDVAPFLSQGRTFLPARYVAEGLGYQVAWDDRNQVIICWPQGQKQPDVSSSINWLNKQQKSSNGTWMDITGNVDFAPASVAVDSNGNLYLTYFERHWSGKYDGNIKKLVSGIWTDIAEKGEFNKPNGVAVDSSGNIFVTDQISRKVKKLVSGSHTWIDVTGTEDFGGPLGVAVDNSDNVYVADGWNSKITKLAKGSNTWKDITDNGDFSGPTALAVDSYGNVYVTDSDHGKIKELVSGSSTWIDITDNESFSNPDGLAVDNFGNVYVADAWIGNKITKRISSSNTWTDITLNGGFSLPGGVAVDSLGNVYVADWGNGKIKKLSR